MTGTGPDVGLKSLENYKLIHEWFGTVQDRGLREDTLKSYRADVRQFIKFFLEYRIYITPFRASGMRDRKTLALSKMDRDFRLELAAQRAHTLNAGIPS